jgi:ankyrin repeat protein
MSREFFDAVKTGDLQSVQRLLLVTPSLIHERENGLSPILVAAYHQEPAVANFLAEKTVGLTIFEAAATGKTLQVARLLAHNPELVNEYADDGFQSLGLACFFGHYETAEYLIKSGAGINSPSRNSLEAAPIQSAAAAGHTRIVSLLLENGADPNVREQGGFTPLHAAAQNGDMIMVRILLFNGADMNLKSSDGKLPIDLAAQAGHERVVALMREGITRRFRKGR